MIAVDTNILIYAHREDSSFHQAAKASITELAESTHLWGIPWPCIHEFFAIVTHPKIYYPPSTLEEVIQQIEDWLECPTLEVFGESAEYWPLLRGLLEKGKITGPRVHDTRIVAICLQNGVKTLWSADRDFTRVEGIEIRNPLI